MTVANLSGVYIEEGGVTDLQASPLNPAVIFGDKQSVLGLGRNDVVDNIVLSSKADAAGINHPAAIAAGTTVSFTFGTSAASNASSVLFQVFAVNSSTPLFTSTAFNATGTFVMPSRDIVFKVSGVPTFGVQFQYSLSFDSTTTPPADTTAPTLVSTTPADNATGVAAGANLLLNFSEAVKAGSGVVEIRKVSDNSLVTTIDINDASQASFSASTLTLNPAQDLNGLTAYYVKMAAGVVKDLANNSFAGISTTTRFNFTTAAAPDVSGPLLLSTTPADNTNGVSLNSDITMTFNEAIKTGSGSVEIRKSSDGSLVTSIAVTDTSQITLSGSTLRINPAGSLETSTGYYVTMSAGAVKDAAGNSHSGISDPVQLNFTTVGSLFTELADSVKFNALSAEDKLKIASGVSPYNALNGDDFVTLPDTTKYQLTSTVRWNPSTPFEGGMGNDTIVGGNGGDTIFGGYLLTFFDDGDDRLDGNGGADRLFGGGGNDTLYGLNALNEALSTVSDYLEGGLGIDTFAVDNRDVIKDMDTGEAIHFYSGMSVDRAVLVFDGAMLKATVYNDTYSVSKSITINNGFSTRYLDATIGKQDPLYGVPLTLTKRETPRELVEALSTDINLTREHVNLALTRFLDAFKDDWKDNFDSYLLDKPTEIAQEEWTAHIERALNASSAKAAAKVFAKINLALRVLEFSEAFAEVAMKHLKGEIAPGQVLDEYLYAIYKVINPFAATTGAGVTLGHAILNLVIEEMISGLGNVIKSFIPGTDGPDIRNGTNGPDFMVVGKGDDVARAMGGDDLMVAGSGQGNDTYDGGVGIDTVTYFSTTQGVIVDLVKRTATGAEIDKDLLIAVENIYGGDGNDAIKGNTLANFLSGGAGNDVLDGYSGNDSLDGGAGNDALTGGAGIDEARFSGSAADYQFFTNAQKQLFVEDLRALAPDGIDTLIGIETLDFSDATVSLAQAMASATYLGTAPTDMVLSRVSVSEAAAVGAVIGKFAIKDPDKGDSIALSLFDDAGGRFALNGASLIVGTGAKIDYETDKFHFITVRAVDSFGLVYDETLKITVANATDPLILTGNDNPNTLTGATLGDTIQGMGGNDILRGGGGNDLINGGLDDDQIWGDAGNDTIYGDEGFDLIDGGAGNDKLYGGAGDEWITGGLGADHIDGGAGADAANYHGSTAGLTVDFADPTKNTGEAAGDTYFETESIGGSDFADKLYGDDGNNGFLGQNGNDIIDGREGDDFITGNAGVDTLTGGAGSDYFGFASAKEGADIITDFVSGVDKITASMSGFGITVDGGGTLPYGAKNISTAPLQNYFVSGTLATESGHGQFIFDAVTDPSHGRLYWDPDGTGAVGKLLLADLRIAAVTDADIWLFA